MPELWFDGYGHLAADVHVYFLDEDDVWSSCDPLREGAASEA